MKNFLMIFTAFISPLLPLALIITLFIVIDTFVGRSGVRRSLKTASPVATYQKASHLEHFE